MIILFFYRVVPLNTITNKGILYSPCFGTINEINRHGPNDTTIISSFIGLSDPHIQYIPASGRIINQSLKKGSWYPAFMLGKSKNNERLITNIQLMSSREPNVMISVLQIGGVIMNNIQSFVKQGQLVNQNQELGMIGLSGSRCEIIVPNKIIYRIPVQVGQYVTNASPIIELIPL